MALTCHFILFLLLLLLPLEWMTSSVSSDEKSSNQCKASDHLHQEVASLLLVRKQKSYQVLRSMETVCCEFGKLTEVKEIQAEVRSVIGCSPNFKSVHAELKKRCLFVLRSSPTALSGSSLQPHLRHLPVHCDSNVLSFDSLHGSCNNCSVLIGSQPSPPSEDAVSQSISFLKKCSLNDLEDTLKISRKQKGFQDDKEAAIREGATSLPSPPRETEMTLRSAFSLLVREDIETLFEVVEWNKLIDLILRLIIEDQGDTYCSLEVQKIIIQFINVVDGFQQLDLLKRLIYLIRFAPQLHSEAVGRFVHIVWHAMCSLPLVWNRLLFSDIECVLFQVLALSCEHSLMFSVLDPSATWLETWIRSRACVGSMLRMLGSLHWNGMKRFLEKLQHSGEESRYAAAIVSLVVPFVCGQTCCCTNDLTTIVQCGDQENSRVVMLLLQDAILNSTVNYQSCSLLVESLWSVRLTILPHVREELFTSTLSFLVSSWEVDSAGSSEAECCEKLLFTCQLLLCFFPPSNALSHNGGHSAISSLHSLTQGDIFAPLDEWLASHVRASSSSSNRALRSSNRTFFSVLCSFMAAAFQCASQLPKALYAFIHLDLHPNLRTTNVISSISKLIVAASLHTDGWSLFLHELCAAPSSPDLFSRLGVTADELLIDILKTNVAMPSLKQLFNIVFEDTVCEHVCCNSLLPHFLPSTAIVCLQRWSAIPCLFSKICDSLTRFAALDCADICNPRSSLIDCALSFFTTDCSAGIPSKSKYLLWRKAFFCALVSACHAEGESFLLQFLFGVVSLCRQHRFDLSSLTFALTVQASNENTWFFCLLSWLLLFSHPPSSILEPIVSLFKDRPWMDAISVVTYSVVLLITSTVEATEDTGSTESLLDVMMHGDEASTVHYEDFQQFQRLTDTISLNDTSSECNGDLNCLKRGFLACAEEFEGGRTRAADLEARSRQEWNEFLGASDGLTTSFYGHHWSVVSRIVVSVKEANPLLVRTLHDTYGVDIFWFVQVAVTHWFSNLHSTRRRVRLASFLSVKGFLEKGLCGWVEWISTSLIVFAKGCVARMLNETAVKASLIPSGVWGYIFLSGARNPDDLLK